jgi:diaphanous 1
MKGLNWTKIAPNQIKNTIWEKIDDSKVKFNIDNFISEFSQKKIVQKKSSQKTEQKKIQKQCFSQPDRQRNVNIVLNKLHLEPIDISDALIEFDLNILTPNACDLLLPIVPSENEFNTISNETQNLENEDQFDSCDLFIILIGSIVGYKERLQSILFKSYYKEKSIEILKLIDYFFNGFDFILTNEHLKKILEVILAHGNYLNGITMRGGAFGFNLDSLSKIEEMKSKDNKLTLLEYIIHYIIDEEGLNKPEYLDIMSYLELFDQMQMKSITESFNELNSKFKVVQSLKEKIINKKNDLEENDKTEEFLNKFFEHAEKTMKFIESKIKIIEEKYEEIIKYFAEDKNNMTLEKLVDTFKKLNKCIIEALRKYKETKLRNLKELKK